MSREWSSVALCVIGPLVWGIASARAYDWWTMRRQQPAEEKAEARDIGPMYYI